MATTSGRRVLRIEGAELELTIAAKAEEVLQGSLSGGVESLNTGLQIIQGTS